MSSRVYLSFTSPRLFLCALLILILAGTRAQALDYSCSNCASPDCVCANIQPPGGLDPTNVPQIVLITFDDAVSTGTYAVCQSILTNHVNPNGTPIQATFYINTDWNDYRLTQQLYAQGHEIAIHTMTHTTTTNTDVSTWRREIYGCRKAISDLAQIPLEDIVGFRAPGLDYNHFSFQALAEAGMVYDASIAEGLGGLSMDGSRMIWPYTFDNGLAQIAYKPAPQSNFPGLFEVPLWQTFNGSGAAVSTMDFPAGTSNEILDIFKLNLENRYFGTRAPMGLFMHATAGYSGSLGEPGQAWRIDLLNEFIRWALSNPDFGSNIWFVSARDAVDYMKNPVALTAITSFPPFVTTPKTIPPVSMVVTCVWTSAYFRTCGECPPVYPAPENVFGSAVAVTGGVIQTTNYETYATEYGSRLEISNNTDRVVVEWEAEFRTFRGQIKYFMPGLYTTTVVGSGTKVVAHPYPTLRPLYPGEVETNYFWVTNTAGSSTILDKKITLYALTNTQPTIAGVVFTDTNRIVASWDNVAANYELMFTTNQDFSNWQSVEVHGRTSAVTVLPPGTDHGYFKLKTMY